MKNTIENPYQTPQSDVEQKLSSHSRGIWRKGNRVIVTAETIWPDRCIKCNNKTNDSITKTLAYVNPWIYLSVLISILITVILAVIFQKKFTMSLPLCSLHQRKRKNILIINWVLALFLGLGVWLSMANIFKYGYVISIITLLAILIIGWFGRLAYITKYKNPLIFIKGARREFLDSLDEYQE